MFNSVYFYFSPFATPVITYLVATASFASDKTSAVIAMNVEPNYNSTIIPPPNL